uniref:Secreted protein n=1 Tax=Panagrellus redivivus TaxID=6233 RepID=A0A7E4ZWY4_PANRE
MNWQSCLFILPCLVISTQCSFPVIIKSIPTLADFNLTAPKLTADELKKVHAEYHIRLRAQLYCNFRPREFYTPDKKGTKVDVYQPLYPFPDRKIAVFYVNKWGGISEIISDYDNIYHVWLEVYFQFDFYCPNHCAGTYISILSSPFHCFTNREATANYPWKPTDWTLSDQCDGPRDANGTRYRKQYDYWGDHPSYSLPQKLVKP